MKVPFMLPPGIATHEEYAQFYKDFLLRGLDASTALEWIKAIRAMTDTLGLSTIVTLYQAGNGIYEQFDKLIVLEEG
ncbi:hypothetical protein MY10362_005154 [Beauveria mimosiformis]